MPRDSFNREINYLRISVIDNCNLRCVYCMPLHGLQFLPRPELLNASEIERVVRAAVDAGFSKFRLTGGQPTLRADLLEIVERLADLPGVLIGTANQAQGLEREAVVVIHPRAGYREAPSFATDPGRLCVALSRHRAHATIVVDTNSDAVLRHARTEAPNNSALAIQRYVLAALLGPS